MNKSELPPIISFEHAPLPECFKYNGTGDVVWDPNKKEYRPLSEIIKEEKEEN